MSAPAPNFVHVMISSNGDPLTVWHLGRVPIGTAGIAQIYVPQESQQEARGEALEALERVRKLQEQETDWDAIRSWTVAERGRAMALDSGSVRLWDGDGLPVFQGGVPTAAAWVRRQRKAET